jgi:tetratricopeptide (TPR) repeat protein/predicted aspartyl protease
MARWFGAASVVFMVLLAPAPALAEACQIGKHVEIPVTMAGRRPIVTAQINGRDARFILDSGAFFSTIAKASALEYGLSIRDVAPGARFKGIGGEASLGAATVKELGIGGRTIPHIEFAVGGSDTGYAGLLGQNILGLADVEYDLPHGAARLMTGKGCKASSMAYWAGAKPVTLVEIEPMGAGQWHTIGTIIINGVKIKALFDSGAMGSMLTLSAAKRLGVTPDSAGVTPSGFAYGLGQSRARAWRARFDSIDVGGEAIKKPWMEIADLSLDGPDRLIGIAFFLTHRLYVDNQYHRMFITYEGGPMFGLRPKAAIDSTGAALDLTDKAGEPTDAAGYSRRGAIRASSRKLDEAIADFDKAVAMAPGEAHYVLQRAMAHLANRQPLLGAADLDKAIELAPGDADARLARAQLRLGARDPTGALVDLKAADQLLAPSSDARLRLANMYNAVDTYELALASYDHWLKTHPEDHDRAVAFNGRCWSRALLNQDLDQALGDCDAALRLRPGEAAYLDSRALVRLRRGELDKALADYDAAVVAKPRNAWSLYARSIVERRVGKTVQADADRAEALSINPQVGERAKRYRLEG